MKRPRLPVPASLLVLALANPAPAGPVSPSAHGAGEGASALEAALDTLETEDIAADVRFLSSDFMRGRDTPSLELRVAARYVRARLAQLGFEPGVPEGWFHEYPLDQARLDPESALEVVTQDGASLRLAYGEDCYLASTRGFTTLDVDAPAVFCGKGERGDYKEADVEGAWAVVWDGDGTDTRRIRYAERAGAVGLLVLGDETRRSRARDDMIRRFGGHLERGVVSYPSEKAKAGESPFPFVILTSDASARVMAALGGEEPSLGQRLPCRVRDKRLGGGRIQVENVVGLWPGADPDLADEVILLSAHYDHVGAKGEEVWNGADDNASGTSGLLAVADALSAYGPMRRSIMLVWVSGEEKGLWGSRAFADAPPLADHLTVICNLNVDMIGRNAPGELYVTPSPAHEQHNGLVGILEDLAPGEGFPALHSADEYYHRSDHAMFARMGIPVAFLFNGVHEDYHQPSDTSDKVDADKIRRVSRLVVRALEALQDDTLSIATTAR